MAGCYTQAALVNVGTAQHRGGGVGTGRGENPVRGRPGTQASDWRSSSMLAKSPPCTNSMNIDTSPLSNNRWHVQHTALSDQGNHLPYTLHSVYYFERRGGQVSRIYHTLSSSQPRYSTMFGCLLQVHVHVQVPSSVQKFKLKFKFNFNFEFKF